MDSRLLARQAKDRKEVKVESLDHYLEMATSVMNCSEAFTALDQVEKVKLINRMADSLKAAAGVKRDYEKAVADPANEGKLKITFSVGANTLEQVEEAYLRATLDLFKGNKKATAAAIGCSRSALYAKLNRWDGTPNGGAPAEDPNQSKLDFDSKKEQTAA